MSDTKKKSNIPDVKSPNFKIILLSCIILFIVSLLILGYFQLEETTDKITLLAAASPIIAALIQTWSKLIFEIPSNESKTHTNKKSAIRYKTFFATLWEVLKEFVKCFINVVKFKNIWFSVAKLSCLVIAIILLLTTDYFSKLSMSRNHIVTKEEYSKFLEDTKILPPLKIDTLNKNDPIINVDWHNASKYCAWHNGRLYTEKEWRENVTENQIYYKYREWTSTDTLTNCSVVCDSRYASSTSRCESWEPKDKYSDTITFRCVHLGILSPQFVVILKFCLFSVSFILIILFLLPFKKYCI